MSKIILLDSIRSMQNVGAIFRNADGAGFEKVILTGTTPTPPRNDISKTALGAETFIDWEYYKNPFEILENLREKGYIIISVELDERSIDYTELYKQKNPNVVLVMGNEVSGVNKTILDISDEIVIIPMRGQKESLNVSVAAGIVMYSVN
ncbi:MAG: TrmH family RNA methyltransferase [Candidatus Gracilibacteria bacterium]|nr:TrmH family RNA methyltransferase [Candidatus Gracilibacteria bacterium]